jgi:hypothetical protein
MEPYLDILKDFARKYPDTKNKDAADFDRGVPDRYKEKHAAKGSPHQSIRGKFC